MKTAHKMSSPLRKPPWLKRRIAAGAAFLRVNGLLLENRLHTVCQEARCPNQGECFSRGTAAFLILGDRCTRTCRFCAVAHGPVESPDPGEPFRVAEAVRAMGRNYVVVTSVTRDDRPGNGAEHFAKTIREIRRKAPLSQVEVLIPDFQGSDKALGMVIAARPDVLNHNMETVPRLYPKVRPGADYHRSLRLIRRAAELIPEMPTKSGLMLGLGETAEEVKQVLMDLLEVNCRIITLGQYLQPTGDHLAVERFLSPDEFEGWQQMAIKMGFSGVSSGPFVRSSYHAKALYDEHQSSFSRADYFTKWHGDLLTRNQEDGRA